MGATLDEIVKVENTLNDVRGFQDRPHFKLLKSGLNRIASEFYNANAVKGADGKAQELILDEDKAKKIADQLWNTAADMVAVNYLKMKGDAIKSLKEGKDGSGQSNWETLMVAELGIDKERLYQALKTRGRVTPEEIPVLYNAILEQYTNAANSKLITTRIKELSDAQAVAEYVNLLKDILPEAFAGVKFPTRITGVQEAQAYIPTAATLLAQKAADYKLTIAAEYKQKAA